MSLCVSVLPHCVCLSQSKSQVCVALNMNDWNEDGMK